MNVLIYCRKSTDDDNHQVLSIDSQISEMRKLAERSNLKVTKTYKESMTAKAPGRPVFGEMMNFIEKHKDSIILVWKLDRLARNPVDEGKIKWLLQQGIITQIKTPDRDYLPSDNVLIASVEFGMANQYIRDLRQNVMRGNRTKLEKGGWPNMAPFGYLNNRLDKTIVIDGKSAPAIRRLFDLYSTGNYSLKEITKIIYSEGFIARNGKKISKSNIHKILQNHFYYGVMVRDGVYYQGNYEPLISKELFDKADEVLNGKSRSKRQKHIFPLSGLMTCKNCGCLMTATIQKRKYVYYYCTNGKGGCDQRKKHLKAEDAYLLVSDVVQYIKTDEKLLDIACKASEEKYALENKTSDSARQKLLKRLEATKEQQDTLARRKDTPDDVYARNMASLRNEQVDLETQLAGLGFGAEDTKTTFEQVKNIFREANTIANSFLHADDSLKRSYAEMLVSNILVKDNIIQDFQFKMPYQLIAELPENPTLEQLCAGKDSNLRRLSQWIYSPPRLTASVPAQITLSYTSCIFYFQ